MRKLQRQQSTEVEEGSSHVDPSFTDKVNILLVDDHEENLIALEAILNHPDYNLVKCTSGKEALKEVLKSDFALFMLDVKMPEMDGFELASLIRSRERTRSTPIVFLTAVAKEVRYIYRGYRIGAVDYLAKPLEPEVVIAKVNVFVDLFRKNQQIKHQAELLRRGALREKENAIYWLKEQSERRYRDLAEAIPQIVWTASANGNPKYFNQQWNQYSSAGENTFTSEQPWEAYQEIFHPDDFAPFLAGWRRSVEHCNVFQFQCRIKRLHSYSYRWHLCRALPEREPEGEVVGWLGTWTDIHDQKQVEEQQRFLVQSGKTLASSLNFGTTLQSMAEIAVPYIADWCIVDIKNPGSEMMRSEIIHGDAKKHAILHRFKTLKEDKKQIGISKMLPSASPSFIAHISSERLREISSDQEHFELLNILGTRSVMVVPLETRGQSFGTLTFVAGDSNRTYGESDLRLAGEFGRQGAIALENARLYEVARNTNRLRDEFLATVSHELRTPLGAVLGWSELLLANTYDDDTTKSLETIHRNGKTLARLVEDLLDVSRIITGKISLSIQNFALTPVIESAMETVRPAAEAKGIDLERHIDAKVGLIVGDSARIQQIIWNLVSNAIKFTPKGGQVKLRVMRSSDGDAVLEVSDTGMGIKTDFLPHLFERFRQADGTTTRSTGGLGLGLAIVRHLVELHGGNVEAFSQGEGKGSVFTVRLPMNPRLEQDKYLQNIPAVKTDPADFEMPSLNGLSILVVDDQQDSREFISTALLKKGALVTHAASVREAVTALQKERPHIVLSDIGMPYEDGFVLLEYLKQQELQEGVTHIPIAALTAYVGKDNQNKVLSAGFDAYMAKPVKIHELIRSVAYLTGIRSNSGS